MLLCGHSSNRNLGEHLAVMTSLPPKDRFSEWYKGCAVRRSLCESAPSGSPCSGRRPALLLAASAICSQYEEKALYLEGLQGYSLKAQLQPGNFPTQPQQCHCLTSFQPRLVVTAMVHFCCNHHCQGKLGRANPCHSLFLQEKDYM